MAESDQTQPTPPASTVDAIDALARADFHLALTDEEPSSLAGAVRLPLSAVPVLGVALSSLPQAARTAATQAHAPHLLVATDKFGNPLGPYALNRTTGGMIGSYGGGSAPLNQARFHKAGADSTRAIPQIPYDPTALFAATALAQINQKLDSIQRSVDELYAYARQRDKSRTRANAQALSSILADHDVNQGNATYIANAHMKVLDIRQESRAAMGLNRERAQASLGKAAPLGRFAPRSKGGSDRPSITSESIGSPCSPSPSSLFWSPCPHRTSQRRSSGPARDRSRRSRCATESSTRVATMRSRRPTRTRSMPRSSVARHRLRVGSATPSRSARWRPHPYRRGTEPH